MKINHRILVTVLVSALAVPGIALAAKGEKKKDDGADKAAGAFAKADKDSDGFVTESEFVASRGKKADQGKMKTQFGKMDKNGDGKLSKDEFAAAASGKGGKKNK
jgi:Ca2+-binding EF-hand superfamily protein